MKSNHNYIVSNMWCTKCGKQGVPIIRKIGACREPGHLKKLYCIHCKEMVNHVEIRPIYGDYSNTDFKLEIKYHNFDVNGNRKQPYRIFRGQLKQKGVI